MAAATAPTVNGQDDREWALRTVTVSLSVTGSLDLTLGAKATPQRDDGRGVSACFRGTMGAATMERRRRARPH